MCVCVRECVCVRVRVIALKDKVSAGLLTFGFGLAISKYIYI